MKQKDLHSFREIFPLDLLLLEDMPCIANLALLVSCVAILEAVRHVDTRGTKATAYLLTLAPTSVEMYKFESSQAS